MRSGRGFEVNIQNFTWSVMALLNNKKSTEPKSIEAYPSKFKLKISTRSKNKQTNKPQKHWTANVECKQNGTNIHVQGKHNFWLYS